jgi:hypothetical protein
MSCHDYPHATSALPTAGEDKHIIISPKFEATHYIKSASDFSVAFPKAMG